MMRKCTKCGEEKELDLFAKTVKRGKKCFRAQCKKCVSERTLKARKANPERVEKRRVADRERQKRLRAEAPERLKSIEVKRKASEGYKQWVFKYAAIEREIANKEREERAIAWVFDNQGSYTVVTPVCCSLCGKSEVRKGDYTHRPENLRYCKSCAAIPGNQLKGLIFKTIPLCCNECGSSFLGTGRTNQCDPCRLRAINKRVKAKRKALGLSTRSHLRSRARRHGVYIDTVTPKKVYERDKWRCVSCKCKVVVSQSYQPNQASIDHIIPLSMGGSHTYGNVQTMCVVCNSSKSNNLTSSVQLTVFDVVREPTYRGGIKIV